MRKQNLLLIVLLITCLMCPHIEAAETICQLEKSAIGIKAIAWDDSTGKAKLTDSTNTQYFGQVILRRPHDTGEKINMYFKYNPSRYGEDAAEFIVFPTSKGVYRVIGVSAIADRDRNGVAGAEIDEYLNDAEYHESGLREDHETGAPIVTINTQESFLFHNAI